MKTKNLETASNTNKLDRSLNLFSLSWPIFLELFLFMLMGIVDTLMLSDISDNAVSGVGAANQFLHISILILEVIGNGASIVVAQYIGSKKFLDASRIAALAVTLNLIVGVIMSVIFITFGNHLLTALNLQGEVYDYASKYLIIVGGAIFLQAIINSLAAIIRVHGYTKQAMYVSAGMNVIHIVGNYALIFGHFGFPQLGVEGAAISTIVSRAIAIVVFFWLLYQVMEVRIQLKHYFSISKVYVSKILSIGVPSALEQVMYQSCQIVFLFYVTFLGEESLAARQYANNVSMFIYLFAMAIGIGTSIIVGRYIGAGRQDDAYRQVWKSAVSASAATLIMVLVVIIFRFPLISIFTDNAEIIKLGASVLVLSILLETGRTINIVVINSLRASGDAVFPMLIGFLSMVCMSISLGYLFVFKLDMGLAGVWLAIAADEWLRAIVMSIRWKNRKWEQHALIKPGTNIEA